MKNNEYNVVKKTVDDNGVITIYAIDNVKLEFKKENWFQDSENLIRKYFEDEKENWWGEYIYYIDGQIRIKGFHINNKRVGMLTTYKEDGSIKKISFYSFEKPGENIDENEYKRQLAKIRIGIWKVPALNIKVSDYER